MGAWERFARRLHQAAEAGWPAWAKSGMHRLRLVHSDPTGGGMGIQIIFRTQLGCRERVGVSNQAGRFGFAPPQKQLVACTSALSHGPISPMPRILKLSLSHR